MTVSHVRGTNYKSLLNIRTGYFSGPYVLIQYYTNIANLCRILGVHVLVSSNDTCF